MTCWNCKYNKNEDYQFCRKCKVNLYAEESKRVKPLTEWESMKLSFYRDEKKWIDHIKSRKVIDGKTYVTNSHGEITGEMPNSRG